MSLLRRARRRHLPPLGPDFTRLWSASAITNLGDGALLAAGPLLAACLSSSAVAVSAAVVVQQLPKLLFALFAGALVDRLPRRAVLVAANLARSAVLGVLALTVLTGDVHRGLFYSALFLMGVGESLADTAYGAILVCAVDRASLGRANTRLALTFSLNNQLLGPPLGALAFAVLWALPFAFDAMAFALAGLLTARISQVSTPTPETEEVEQATLRAQITRGLVFVWTTPGLRTLCGCILVMNLTGVGAFAIWVLYAREHLGLSDTGFGFFISAGAVGGIAGSWMYGWLEQRVGRGWILRVGLLVESGTYAALALATDGVVAGGIMGLFGVHTMVWGIAATTVRQRLTPDHLLGRVGSAYMVADLGGVALGALAGGFLAEYVGLLVPFWIAAGAVGLLAVVAWPSLGRTEQTTV
ncbi:MFS transporter [Nocardiopsis sp. CT-R113]|uniref:MFS transporter n=1 Tax=Nocardiopsis codii TaxID=3065942 RepID=A0ABU7KG63_9ACTN|nr:MFS transporter [Nocardiopsis sp. CT-R113]MEE2041017.1 MFS transporter [Nocardiopsis sp. CT-R113]